MSLMSTSGHDFWWNCEKLSEIPEHQRKDKAVHLKLFDYVRSLEQHQHDIHRLNLFNAKLYSNRDLMAINWNTSLHHQHNHGPASYVLENLIGNVVDSVTALIGKNRPKATPVVRDADFTVEREARKLDRFLWAEANHLDLFGKMQRVFNDSLWAQIGALKIDIDGDEVYCERVMPDEIIVDQRECIADTTPLQVHQRKLISKVQLAGMFPEHADAIYGLDKKRWTDQRSPDAEHLVVIETWFLGIGEKGSETYVPGRRVICTDGITLLDEPYTRDRFPFVFLRWTQLPTGFYSKSLVEELTPYQLRHNEINRVIKLAQDLMCVPRIFVEAGSRFIKTQLDNDICRVLQYKGTPPVVMNWEAVANDLYAERDRNRDNAFQFAGLSQLFAQQKPTPGMRYDSSKAIREASYQGNERFAPKYQGLENAYLEAYEHIIELYSILRKSGKPAKPRSWRDQTLVDTISWDDVNLDRNKYVLELQASSVLNMSPAAREDQLKEWALTGRIDIEQLNGLSGNPDLEGEESLFRASMDDIKAICEEIDDGKNPQPDPFQNLHYGLSYIHKKYLKRSRQVNVPESVLQGYRDWLTEAQALLEDQEAQAAQQAALTQAALQPQNLGPEGNVMPATAVTAQGVPTEGLV